MNIKVIKAFSTLFVATICIALSACSNEDEPSVNNLKGTTWAFVSQTGSDTYSDFEFKTIKFEKDGNCTITPPHWNYAKWSVVDNKLRIVLGDDEPDDYVEGTFNIFDKTGVFAYSWYDCNGKWGGESRYVMTLKRK